MPKYLVSAVFSLFLLCFGFSPALIAQEKAATAAQSTTATRSTKAIARIWHGAVLKEKADEYGVYLHEAGIRKILAIPGNLGVQVFRRNEGKTTEFTVISFWESIEAIKRFAGEDYEKTHHLPKDQEYLLRLEPLVVHHEVVFEQRTAR